MSELNQAMVERYRNDFLKEVEANVEQGEWVRMCMQCGLCSGSCPLGEHWEHPPHEIFMLIRAGRRDQVLRSDSAWMCTSCYSCIVRCPRGLPITHIMHGLAHYAKRLGIAPEGQPTMRFSRLFWDNLMKRGRVNELKLGLSLYFMNGFAEGVRTSLKMKDIGLGMLRAGRMNPVEIAGGQAIEDVSGFQKMIRKARELEDARIARHGTK